MKDLVQIDIETAIVLYSKGYKHIPIMQGDPFSEDWTSKQPLYLDDLLESLVIFASDSKREQLLNPPKVDIKTVKEDIAMEYKPRFRIDPGGGRGGRRSGLDGDRRAEGREHSG